MSGSYCHLHDLEIFDTEATLTGGRNLYITGDHTLVERTILRDAGKYACVNAGDYNKFVDLTAINWGLAGFLQSGAAKRVDLHGGNFEYGAASVDGQAILFASGSNVVDFAVIRDTVVDWDSAHAPSGTPTLASFSGALKWLVVENSQFRHANTRETVVIGAGVKRATFDHTFLARQLKLDNIDSDAVILLDDTQIGSDALWNGGVQPANAVLGIGGGQFIARSSQFIGYTAAALEVVVNLQSSTSFKHFEASDCLFYAYNTGVTTYEVTTSGSGAVNVSRKILWLNNRSLNGGGSASQYSILNDDQKILFTTRDWSKRVMQAAGTPVGSTVTWQDGDIIMRDTPTSGGTIGWVKTSAGWKTFGTIQS